MKQINRTMVSVRALNDRDKFCFLQVSAFLKQETRSTLNDQASLPPLSYLQRVAPPNATFQANSAGSFGWLSFSGLCYLVSNTIVDNVQWNKFQFRIEKLSLRAPPQRVAFQQYNEPTMMWISFEYLVSMEQIVDPVLFFCKGPMYGKLHFSSQHNG